MLKEMRDNLKSFHWVLWLVVVAFIVSIFFWDTGVQWTGGLGAGWAASVNGEQISARDFQDGFQRQVEFLKRLSPAGQFDPGIIESVGVADQVLDQLIQQKAALQEAKRLGLQATPDEIKKQVITFPAFTNDEGSFVGLVKYREVLRRAERDVEEFEASLSDGIALAKFEDLMRSTVVIGDDEVDRAIREQRERVSIDYVRFDPSGIEVTEEPGEEELLAWYEEHSDQFLRDEMRRVAWVHLTQARALEEVADEAEMRAYYEEKSDRFAIPENHRRGRWIVVRIPPGEYDTSRDKYMKQAEDLVARIEAGEDFAELARAHSDDLSTARRGGDLGHFGQGELIASVDQAFFEMEVGEVRGPIETAQGLHIIQLTEAGRGAHQLPFEDATDEIASILYFSKMQERIDELAADMEAGAQDGTGLAELAAKHGLELQEAELATGEGIRSLGSFPEIVQAITEGLPGEVKGPLPAVDADRAFLEVLEVIEPQPAAFEEVRDEAVEAWRAQRAAEEARIAAEDLATALNESAGLEGPGLAEKAEAQGLTMEQAGPFTRTSFVGPLGRQPLLQARAFSTPVGSVGPLTKMDDSWVVFVVTAHEEVTQEELESERENTRSRLAEQQFRQVWGAALGRLAEQADIRVNRPYITAVQREFIRRSTPAPSETEDGPEEPPVG